VPLSFLRGSKRLRWSEVDRLLALALTLYEDGLCSGCGQPKRLTMDPDLADEWTTTDPFVCAGCVTLSVIAKQNKDADHPHSMRYVLGMSQGWEQRKAAKVAEGVTSPEA
jgi:hypothetical protein